MTTNVPIERKRGDTFAIVYRVLKDDVVVDISSWTAFLLTVDPSKTPADALANEFQVSGAFVTDGTDGKVKFIPPGTTDIGTYYYDIQGIDPASGKTTVVEGKYKIKQDITKD